jgi:ABC-type phosphate transport system substrate-binding protein
MQLVRWAMTFVAAAIVAAGAASAGEPELGGRPFSAPDTIMQMPQAWLEKRLTRPNKVDIALALDQQLYPAVLPLVRRYAAEHGISVALQEGTCGVAAGALAEKNADITGMCCPPGVVDRLPGVRFHTLGIAALALIANPANRVDDVSLKQARAMFSGTASSWSELPPSGVRGEGDDRVRAVTRLHCKARPGHWRLLLDNADLFTTESFEVPAIRDMIAEVARSRAAIGYETLWHIDANQAAGAVKALRLDGVDPRDGDALARGRYPLYRVFNITSWTEPDANPAAHALVAYLIAHADDIAPSFGIVPVRALRRNGWQFAGDEVIGEPDRR